MEHHGRMTDTSGKSRFPTISKLSKSLLLLPHSNADAERIFSQVTLIKTKTRNKLKTETLDALVLVKQGLPCNCIELKPYTATCKCINAEMYDSDSLFLIKNIGIFLRKN